MNCSCGFRRGGLSDTNLQLRVGKIKKLSKDVVIFFSSSCPIVLVSLVISYPVSYQNRSGCCDLSPVALFHQLKHKMQPLC